MEVDEIVAAVEAGGNNVLYTLLRTLGPRAKQPLLLGPWERDDLPSPKGPEAERWSRMNALGERVGWVNVISWISVERSGRRENDRASGITVDLTAIGKTRTSGTTPTVHAAFARVDTMLREAGCVLLGEIPDQFKAPPPPAPKVVPAPAPKIVLAPPLPSLPDAVSNVLSMIPPRDPPKLSVVESEPAATPAATPAPPTTDDPGDAARAAFATQVAASLTTEPEALKEVEARARALAAQVVEPPPAVIAAPATGPVSDEVILAAIRKLAPATVRGVVEATGATPQMVREALQRLLRASKIEPKLRPKRAGDPDHGVAEFGGAVIEGWLAR